ncbi:Oxygen tolerance [Tardiphaga sp. OK246]|uniref:BatD family protein n=1 Tax=Tardiphaga sp. OK246 TaxID=1855307 RepID=UPI000B62FD5F|nr:BatD family protein [Tardiphaga sp. OK246]SNT12008.1 Oxygen tolerance [Tardiphaga sp. OK246]
MMSRCVRLGLVIALQCSSAHAAEPLARMIMPPGSPYMAGARIDIKVEVLVPKFFMSAPQFPSLDISGAIVSLSEDSAMNFSETIDGESYSGIWKKYEVVPMQSGRFAVPEVAITFSYAAVPGQATQASVRIPQQTFEAVLPLGATGPDGPLPLSPLEITQTWEPDNDGLKVGDAVSRTVTVFASGMQAMMIPPTQLNAPDGAKFYRRDPVLSDERKDGRNFAGGRRIDRVTYQFVKAGEYELPAVIQHWYDAENGKVQIASAPGRHFSVAVGSEPNTAISPEAELKRSASGSIDWKSWLPRILAMLLVIAVAFACAYMRILSRVIAFVKTKMNAYQQGEAAVFKRLRASCRSNDRIVVYRALEGWAAVARIGPISDWARKFGGAALTNEIERLNRDLFSGRLPTDGWTATSLEGALVTARRSFRRTRSPRRKHTLPHLNPDWTAVPSAVHVPQEAEMLK